MYRWIETMSSCPKPVKNRCPKPDKEAVALGWIKLMRVCKACLACIGPRKASLAFQA